MNMSQFFDTITGAHRFLLRICPNNRFCVEILSQLRHHLHSESIRYLKVSELAFGCARIAAHWPWVARLPASMHCLRIFSCKMTSINKHITDESIAGFSTLYADDQRETSTDCTRYSEHFSQPFHFYFHEKIPHACLPIDSSVCSLYSYSGEALSSIIFLYDKWIVDFSFATSSVCSTLHMAGKQANRTSPVRSRERARVCVNRCVRSGKMRLPSENNTWCL